MIPADLSSGHRRERVGGSEDGLVVHHGLGGHHRHAAHLGMDLGGQRKDRQPDAEAQKGRRAGGLLLPLTIPYTGTCGVVMGKAMGAGAWWGGQRGKAQRLLTAASHTRLV